MRVILWGINYAPELTGIAPFNTGLCDYLREAGHHVEMVTTFPYYPAWKKVPGDSGRIYRTDDIDGVWVHRCWHYVPARVTNVRRIWHELSFGLTSFFRILFLSRADIYVIVSPPLLLGPLASCLSFLKRRPYVFHVQDLQPDAALGLGMVRSGAFTRLLYWAEGWSYRHATFVSGISKSMLNAYSRKGVPGENQVLFPNWIRWYGRNDARLHTEEERLRRAKAFRAKFGISDLAFIASYSGNLGRKQGLGLLLEAATLLQSEVRSPMVQQRLGGSKLTSLGESPRIGGSASSQNLASSQFSEILFLLIGDGVMRASLTAEIATLGLRNVRMLPLLIENDYYGLLAASNVSLVLQAVGTGQHFFPSKLLSILSARSPVLSVGDEESELARAVMEGGFGKNVSPSDPGALAEALLAFAGSPTQLEEMRENTRWVQQFEGPRVLREFEQKLVHAAFVT